MNLKEAFRYQNKLDQLFNAAIDVLSQGRNVTESKITYLRSKAVKGIPDETVVESVPFEKNDKITELVEFVVYVIREKEKLYAAIKKAKRELDVDIDTETSLNAVRQRTANTLRAMSLIKSRDEVQQNTGSGYCMNNEGNQVPYKCDIRRVTTINFDRNKVISQLKQLDKKANDVSTAIDRAVVTTEVDYKPPFDVNDHFETAFDTFLENK